MVKRRTWQISSLAVGKGTVAAEGIVIDREEELVGVKGRKKAGFFFLRELAAREQSNAMQQQVLVHKQNTVCDWGRRF